MYMLIYLHEFLFRLQGFLLATFYFVLMPFEASCFQAPPFYVLRLVLEPKLTVT
jgi:hypothetical protein